MMSPMQKMIALGVVAVIEIAFLVVSPMMGVFALFATVPLAGFILLRG